MPQIENSSNCYSIPSMCTPYSPPFRHKPQNADAVQKFKKLAH